MTDKKALPDNNQVDWFYDRYQAQTVERDRYLVLCMILGGILALNVIGWIMMLPFKKTVMEPYVVMVDNVTGITATLTSAKTSNLNENSAVIRYFLGKYVQSHESYSLSTVNQQQDYIRALSDVSVYESYKNHWQDPDLLKTQESLGSQGQIGIEVLSVTFPYEDIAHVRYIETIKRSNLPLQKTMWLATLKFDQLEEVDESIAAINPLGLVVVNFETIKENNDA